LRLAGTIIAIGLLLYVLYRQGWSEFLQALRQVSLGVFLACLGFMALSRLCISGRWYVLLRSAGVSLSIWQCLRLVFAGLFANNFLFTTIGGDVVRLGGAVQMRLDGAAVAASLVMDRVIGSAGMATLLPIGLPRLLAAASWTGSAPVALAAVSLPAWLRKLWLKGLDFLQNLLRTFLIWARRPWGLLGAVVWTYGHMACTFTILWLLLRGMGQPVSWWLIGGLWVLSYFVSLLPISMNGLGVQEISITYLYSHFAGASPQACLVLAILMRLLPLLVSLPGVLCLPGLLRRSPAGPPPLT
jgi:uncharacterized membrane protein YbhN (UPF0104 family)